MKVRVKKIALILGSVLLVAFVAIQFIPVARSNPPVKSDVPTSSEVKVVLRRSCYDCHSNETHWPWYSHVAPASWLAARDVNEGREELNFSTWNGYSTQQQVEKKHEAWEEIAESEMPPWFYLAPHRDARLSRADRELLRHWALGSAASKPELEDD